MVSEGRGRLFRRKDEKYLIYLPKNLVEDSMFPLKEWSKGKRGGNDSIYVKISFNPVGNRLIIEKWEESADQ
ncbi:hypothetical protein GWO13_07380 [Candidatus Bathyarchaeota archaeon]|nr:hypothetical protein [Candidatus Bathyarchaeota archaeon]